MKLHRINLSLLLIFALLMMQLPVVGQVVDPAGPPLPDFSKGRGSGSKGAKDEKLSSDLKILSSQYGRSKGSKGKNEVAFSEGELENIFGIDAKEDNPKVNLAVTVKNDTDIQSLRDLGMNIFFQKGNVVYGEATISRLGSLALERDVIQISSVKSARTPTIPVTPSPPVEPISSKGSNGNDTNVKLISEFDKAGLDGTGVIVGVIDSGIDWRHPDFINPDGTSRILAIWDYFDESYRESNGKIGTIPPKLSPEGKNLWGTIYTNAQINAALRGEGTVNTEDAGGHGTAVAGTAAGNGRASDGKYTGVAPQSDLIIVRASECGSFANWLPGAEWIIRQAKEYKKPVVINQSFGGHHSAHDGTQEGEEYLNLVTGKDVPGVIFTVSAGNEGRHNLHATGRFGKTTGGGREFSDPISINIFRRETSGDGTTINSYFDARDDWGITVVPRFSAGLTDADGKPLIFYVFKHQGEVKYSLLEGLSKPDWFDDFGTNVISGSGTDGVKDTLTLWLPPGSYDLFGYGTSANVFNGNFDLYIPDFETADFGRGTTKTGMIGSPGNATNVITVGAYNFRNNWINNLNTQTVVNTPNGYLSEYSNPGGIREKDKIVKPDIVAPATFTISPLSQTAGLNGTGCDGDNMGTHAGPTRTTSNGKYISWEGTSASAPFTAGVIALMLQKNKTLDAEQVREILKQTAKKGGVIGAIPNPDWGFGMLDSAAAIKATPSIEKKNKPTRKEKK